MRIIIELHGFGEAVCSAKQMIDDAVQHGRLDAITYTSIMNTDVESCDGTYQKLPYLNIIVTDELLLDLTLEALREKGVLWEICWQKINESIPAERGATLSQYSKEALPPFNALKN